MPLCLRCDPFLYTGYPPSTIWPPGWGGTPGGGAPVFPLDALAVLCPTVPNTAVCLSPNVQVTVPGQNFTATTEILFDGLPIPATLVSASQMTITVNPTIEPVARTAAITCRDTSGYGAGMGSCAFTFTAAPILTMTCPLQPASAVVGTAALTVTVKGTLFTASSIVMLDGTDQTTTFVNATTLTFQVNPTAETVRTATVSVKDGAAVAATTCPFQFTLVPLLTIVCPVVPATAICGSADVTCTVTGTNYTATSKVHLDGVAQTTTFISATQMSFVVRPSIETVARTAQVTVQEGTNVGTGGPCPFQFTAKPILTVVCPVTPATAVAATPDVVVTVNGTNFTATTIATMDGTDQATTFVSATQIRFTMKVSTETAARTAQIGAREGATVATQTCPFTITIVTLLPVVICPIVPANAICGSAALTATVNGQNFTATSVVLLDGLTQTTTFVSATSLTFQVNPVPVTTPKISVVSVRDTAGTALVTCPFEFLPVPRPVVTYVFPDAIGMDDAVRTVTVTGTGFIPASVAVVTVTDMVTTYISPTQLTFVTQSPMWSNGTMTLRVRNGSTPAGLSTTSVPFVVNTNPGKTSPLMIGGATSAPSGSAPLTVRMLGSGLGQTAQVTVDGAGVPTTWISGGELHFTVDPSALAAGTVLQCSVRLGHQHPEGHDNVYPVPMQNVPFTIT